MAALYAIPSGMAGLGLRYYDWTGRVLFGSKYKLAKWHHLYWNNKRGHKSYLPTRLTPSYNHNQAFRNWNGHPLDNYYNYGYPTNHNNNNYGYPLQQNNHGYPINNHQKTHNDGALMVHNVTTDRYGRYVRNKAHKRSRVQRIRDSVRDNLPMVVHW